MTSVGLAHRSTRHFVAEWTDHEAELANDDPHDDTDPKRVEAGDSGAPARPTPEDRPTGDVDDGWFAGEPL